MTTSGDFHVQGPTKVLWKLPSEGEQAYRELGYTDNEDLIRITTRDHVRTFSRNDQGDMVGTAAYSGTTMTIDMTLISFDQDEFVKLIHRTRGGSGTPAASPANEGLFSTVGGILSDRLISIQILPTRVGEIKYLFSRVMLVTGPEYIDFGNTIKRLAMSFQTVAPTEGTAVVTTSAVT